MYANFGFPEDFEALKSAGVDVRGKVALMRYGKCFRGLKAMNAERAGAVAASSGAAAAVAAVSSASAAVANTICAS